MGRKCSLNGEWGLCSFNVLEAYTEFGRTHCHRRAWFARDGDEGELGLLGFS